jgi:2-oxoglutarate ferredoxin oxidoreductase subunit alpha
MIGQMMEPVEFKKPKKRDLPPKDWATDGTGGKREPNIINSLRLDPAELEKLNIHLQEKYRQMRENETRYEMYHTEDAEFVFVSYGTSSRIVKNAVQQLREKGVKAGLIRPISLWPFPFAAFDELPSSVRALMSVEMSHGQMVDDVRIAAAGRWPVGFYGRSGGMIPTEQAVVEACENMFAEVK